MTNQSNANEDEVSQLNTPIKQVEYEKSTEERLSDNAVHNILPARYLLDDETPDDMFRRVADNVAQAEDDGAAKEAWGETFYKQMSTLQFMPNSPTLMNAGASLQQLSACFVLEPGDSMSEPDEQGRQSILDTVKHAGQIFKSGGGVGYTFSHLRPKGTHIESTDSETSGPLAFMRLYDEVCNTVKQGGKRRGAQMAIMRDDHPDIGRFAVSKREEGAFSNFNISVGITDQFKEAVEDDETYTLHEPRSEFEEPFETVQATLNFYSPEYADSPEAVVDENIWRDHAGSLDAWDWENNETVNFGEKWEDTIRQGLDDLDVGDELELPARFIWDLILDGAWRNGEPGLFYLDETNREHSFDVDEHPEYEIHATNPCAEQPLCNYEACNLGHVNLSLMMNDDARTFEHWLSAEDHDYDQVESAVYDYLFEEAVNWEQLQDTVQIGTRFLDNVVTMSDFPLEEIDDTVEAMRKIGLGVMGWAQMLYQMGIRYGSHESLAAARLVMNFIDKTATEYSHELAEERGSFEAWDDSKYADPTAHADWFREHAHQNPADWEDGYAMRNHNVTTVAPTGTTSMIGDTSGGIEPVYNVAYKKNVGNDIQGAEKLVEFDDYFLQTLEANGIEAEPIKEEIGELMEAKEWESVQQLDSIPQSLKNLFVTTNDISSQEHGMMQRAFQEKNDSGISKTVNLPQEATHADVHNAYMLALADGDTKFGAPIKGLTVYRDQSREEQVLMTNEYTEKELETAREKLEAVGYTVEEPADEASEKEKAVLEADD
jgi:adenosylcobalamin-dependent ribonucleoside-diphosphate reductase